MPNADNDLIGPEVETAPGADSAYEGKERRRPGRSENISPHLVSLLRQGAGSELLVEPSDALRAPTGIAVAVAISLVIWAGLYFGFRAIFG